MARISGGEVLVRCILNEGPRPVFGIPGGQLLPFVDALVRVGRPAGMDYVMTRHEAAAGNMADAWARISGQVGVCCGTVGPGAANLVAAVWVAQADNVPLLVITPQIHSGRAYPFRGSKQQLDHFHLFKPITKWNAVVDRWERIGELFQRAMAVAVSGQPGPVHLDIPVDVIYETRDQAELQLPAPGAYRPLRGPAAPPDLVQEAAKMLAAARQPLIHAGSGVLRARAEAALLALAERLGVPVSATGAARGIIPESHRLALSPKQAGANLALAQADLVLAVGCAFWERDGWGRPPVWGEPDKQRLIHIDVEPEVVGRNRPVDLALIGDAGEVLSQLLDVLGEMKTEPKEGRWAERCKKRELEALEALEPDLNSAARPIHPLRLVGEVRRFFGPEAVYVVDGGNMALWAHLGLRFEAPRRFMFPMHSGHLGVGLPFALGAKMADPQRPVVILHGDGSFMLACHEAETAARLGLKVIDVIGNDRCWSMIKAAQASSFGGRFCGVDLTDVRYDLMAQAMGCHGQRVTEPDDIRPALDRAAASGKTAVLDVVLDPDINMNPPGLDKMTAAWLEGCEM
ncbi:MAG: thiamine pyrophosphate-binding protein [Deltaproteobacteria bacterium]|nr:thiamine pyrophosphate-binding protein [Deltaproteobacteria bacterium]